MPVPQALLTSFPGNRITANEVMAPFIIFPWEGNSSPTLQHCVTLGSTVVLSHLENTVQLHPCERALVAGVGGLAPTYILG